MAGPLLSILIVTYNSAEVIGGCLDSIAAYPPTCAYEIVLADNSSSDGTSGLVRTRYPAVHVIETGENLGFAGGNHAAAAHAAGELLLLLNPDTIATPGAIDALVSAIEADEGRWVAGACLLTAEGAPNTSWGDFPTAGWALLELAPWRRLGLPLRSKRQVGRTCEGVAENRDVDWVSGAAFMVRRATWMQLGGFDTGFFMYFEETDFCARTVKHGGRVSLIPSARIVHLEGASVGQASLRQRVWFTRSLFRFLRRDRGLLSAVVVRAWLLLVNAVLYAAALVGGLVSEGVRASRPRYAALVRVAMGMPVPAVDGVKVG